MTITAAKSTLSVSEAYDEACQYLAGTGPVHITLERLVADLKSHDIDYAVIGGVALFAHGLRRVTDNIDIVLTAEGLNRFVTPVGGKAPLTLSNYDPVFGSNKSVRSVPQGVMINVITTGEYPGDGKPKPVRVPDPKTGAVEIDGVRFVTLEKFIELKLASGMTAPDRLKDLADVQELIKVRELPAEFEERLDPYVRAKFLELYDAVKQSPKD